MRLTNRSKNACHWKWPNAEIPNRRPGDPGVGRRGLRRDRYVGRLGGEEMKGGHEMLDKVIVIVSAMCCVAGSMQFIIEGKPAQVLNIMGWAFIVASYLL